MRRNNLKNKILILLSVFFILVLFISMPGCFENNNNNKTNITENVTVHCDSNAYGPDPLFNSQWHLNNLTNPGYDVNVAPVWSSGNKGEGVVVALVDDGLDYKHEDLSCNVDGTLLYNYTTGNNNINSGEHGTAVAGVAAARDLNGLGGRGAAPRASIAAYNLLMDFTLANEYDALVRNKNVIHISNNSWGPEDGTGQLQPPDSTWVTGIEEGISTGRGGKGLVYTWAAGNGGSGEVDNSNYDGTANFYGVIAVGAIDNFGKRTYYSEKGSNLWIVTYSSGDTLGITTTDITGSAGYSTGNYTDTFGGTSSAAPLAAGVVALMLKANPNLSWRDVKLILAQTAVRIDSTDSDWHTNGASYNINHKYGFGSIDANAAVTLAKAWVPVAPMITYSTDNKSVNSSIPDNNTTGISDTMNISSASGITKIEYIAVFININHPSAGDLEITLKSPSATESILAEQHTCYSSGGGIPVQCSFYQGGAAFRFGTARCLGEGAIGNWTLTVKDRATGNTGTLVNWSMTFYGR